MLKLKSTLEANSPFQMSNGNLQKKSSEPLETKPFKRAHKWDMTPTMTVHSEDDEYVNADAIQS